MVSVSNTKFFEKPLIAINYSLVSQRTTPYRYGFNSKEKLNELEGEGNAYDFGARMLNVMLGRFLSLDPRIKDFQELSPYIFAADKPIRFVDVDGQGPGDRVKAAEGFVGKGIIYSQKASENQGSELRTGISKEALKYLDCSELVCRVLKADNITDKVESMTSQGIANYLSDEKKFEHSTDKAKVGDIAVWGEFKDVNLKDKFGKDIMDDATGKPKTVKVWDGHVGIVSEVDATGNIKLIHAAGAKYGVLENPSAIKPEKYCPGIKFLGYYSPKIETPDGKKIDDVPKVEVTSTSSPTTSATTTKKAS